MAETAARSGLITLLTDFGLSDSYVGQMKGVLWSEAPGLRAVIDLTHGIPAQAVAVGAFQLARAWACFPTGTVHVAVVDPGVGTQRPMLALVAEGHFFVAPDNGLLSGVLEQASQVVRLEPARFARPNPAATFHGRDIFAPAAARLAAGAELGDLGAVVAATRCVTLPGFAAPSLAGLASGDLEVEVLFLDSFGNAITALPGELLTFVEPAWQVEWAEWRLPLRRTYGEVPPGQPLALISSFGTLEVAVREGHAGRQLGLKPGSRLRLRRRGRPEGA